jgi:hypothetical protein
VALKCPKIQGYFIISVINLEILFLGGNSPQNLKAENLSETFTAEMELCKIDP